MDVHGVSDLVPDFFNNFKRWFTFKLNLKQMMCCKK